MQTMKLLGKDIAYEEDYLEINTLKYFVDNPRVYSVVHGTPGFKERPEEEQQEIIQKKLAGEPSVKNLLPEIKRHQGLIEPILVRYDTKEVIEGNSRLTAYRQLHESDSEGDWSSIHCKIVSRLGREELFAFLSEIHLKGKTQWTPYEKYNFAYVRSKSGLSTKKIADLFGESESTIRQRIKVIELMEERRDNRRSHLSYYDVVVRNPNAYKKVRDGSLNRIMEEIKSVKKSPETPDDDDEKGSSELFTAQKLRNALPDLLKKPKVLSRYEDGKISFDEASELATVSGLKRRSTKPLRTSKTSRKQMSKNSGPATSKRLNMLCENYLERYAGLSH